MEEYDIETTDDIQAALRDLLGDTIKSMMEAEMTDHLGYEKSERSDSDNYRNGTKPKTVRSNYGEFQIDVPKDRNGTFDPQVVKNRQKDISGMIKCKRIFTCVVRRFLCQQYLRRGYTIQIFYLVLQIFRMMKFLHRLKLQMRYSTHYHRIFFQIQPGVILREAAKRFIKGLEKEIPNLQERINHIYQNQLFGIGITELTSLLSRRR